MLRSLLPLLVALAVVIVPVGLWVVRAIEQERREATLRSLLATFAPAAATAREDPRRLLGWYPLAQASRRLFPDAFRALDAAAGGTFPFTKEQLQAAHARWTADWLAWEHAHDAEYALKTAVIEDEVTRGGGPASPLLRTRLAALEREKLERYQQRYEEYITTAKALAAIME